MSTAGPTVVPRPGNIDQTVAAVPLTTVTVPAQSSAAQFTRGPQVSIVSMSAITATAAGPGEIAGPAVRLTLRFRNTVPAAIGLDTVTVGLLDGSGRPCSMVSRNGSAPFAGVLPPGAVKDGTFVFSVPAAARKGVTVSVDYSSDAPTLLFTADAPNA